MKLYPSKKAKRRAEFLIREAKRETIRGERKAKNEAFDSGDIEKAAESLGVKLK